MVSHFNTPRTKNGKEITVSTRVANEATEALTERVKTGTPSKLIGRTGAALPSRWWTKQALTTTNKINRTVTNPSPLVRVKFLKAQTNNLKASVPVTVSTPLNPRPALEVGPRGKN